MPQRTPPEPRSEASCEPLLPDRVQLAPDAYVAPTAVLRGAVSVGPRSSVWFHAVLRGDLAPVVIGADSNVQDGAVLHVESGVPAVLGDRVTVGHAAVVHAATVEDDSLIGIGALVLSGARVGRHCIVGAGALVKEGWSVPPRSLVLGVPGRVVREVTEAEMRRVARNWAAYVAYAARYRSGDHGETAP